MRERLSFPQQNVRRVIPGMIGAAEYGTAHRGVDASQGVAGKTGSCISKGSWVGLFASVAPIEQPKYAVVVITRGEHERGKYAAAVAGQVYRALGPQLVRTDRNLAQTEFKIRPRIVAGAPVKGNVADEDGDEDDAAMSNAFGEKQDIAAGRNNVVLLPAAPPVANKKLVQKTGSSKSVFPPVVITYDPTVKDDAPRSKIDQTFFTGQRFLEKHLRIQMDIRRCFFFDKTTM